METCVHCDEVALMPLYLENASGDSKVFCCEGCRTVFQVLHDKGLQDYYEIKSNTSVFKRRSPVELKTSLYQYLDDEEFLREYSYLSADGQRCMEFYLEGIHCLACLWLIEKLPEFLPGVHSSKLEMDQSKVTVVLNQGGTFALAAREFSQFGYRPHPLRKNQTSNDLKKREERTFLIRIGVAGAAAGNIMLYAVSLYGGAENSYAYAFNALTVMFALPVFTWCALPFYQNAWNALRNKTLSIDIPISLSLIVGFIMGLYNLMMGITDNYFDSLTALVFLLLLSRYFLQKIQEKGLSASDLHFFYQNETVLRADPKGGDIFHEIHPRFIRTGDILRVRIGELFPADGAILRGKSSVNNSLLTGESVPVKVDVGDSVFSGTVNLDQEIEIRVTNTMEDSRLGKILRNVEHGWALRAPIVNLTNTVSKYFTLTVIILSALLFITLFQKNSLVHALEGAITLMIVTCPCALALAVPLTFTRSMAKAREAGLVIKSDEVIEKVSKLERVFLDKTGTLTFGKMTVTTLSQLKKSEVPLPEVIYHLEKRSRHPVAFALLDYVKGDIKRELEVSDFEEILGKGVKGTILRHEYFIGAGEIRQDGVVVATFVLKDTVRPDSSRYLYELRNMGLDISVLSGDREEVVQDIAREVGLKPTEGSFGLSPEKKSEILTSAKNSMMVGDGANDAIALTKADVGVAVLGAMDISLRAADVYLTSPGLAGVAKLFIISKETMKVIRRNLILSLCYNSLSVAAAFLGIINPLVAAIIMPVSSLTILLSTLAGTKKLRAVWKS